MGSNEFLRKRKKLEKTRVHFLYPEVLVLVLVLVLVYWHIGILVFWYIGILVYWYIGIGTGVGVIIGIIIGIGSGGRRKGGAVTRSPPPCNFGSCILKENGH